MENYYVRILTKNMRNVYVEAHRRAMKEYYPPHLTGPGSRGVGLLDMVFFDLELHASCKRAAQLLHSFEKVLGFVTAHHTLMYRASKTKQ